jgi:hypothetical protein
MKKRHTEEQIIGTLNEDQAGMPVADLLREHKKLKLVNAAQTAWNETGFIKEEEISETQIAELDAHNWILTANERE